MGENVEYDDESIHPEAEAQEATARLKK